MKKLIPILIYLALLLVLTSCNLTTDDSSSTSRYDINTDIIVSTADSKCPGSEYGNHNWQSPTCIEPSKCFWCGAYKDDKIGEHHNWYTYDNNLTKCRDCSILREDWLMEQGAAQENTETNITDNENHECNARGHVEVVDDAIEPTCINEGYTEGKHCSVCNKIIVPQNKIEAKGHQGEDSSEWSADYDEAINVLEYCCTICEETIEIKSEPITTFVNEDHFTIYPYAFSSRFEEQSSRLNKIDYRTKSEYNEYGFYDEDNTIFYRIQDKNNNYEDIGIMSFTKPNGETVAVMNDFTENCVGCINILIEDSYDVSAVVYATILAIDPSIGYNEAADVGQEIVDNIFIAVGADVNDFSGIDYNGINYILYRDRDYHYLIISTEVS